MDNKEPQNQETTTPNRRIKGESVLGYVVIGCFIIAFIGVFRAITTDFNEPALCLFTSTCALGVVAYIYTHKS
jgi:hypothetical protein